MTDVVVIHDLGSAGGGPWADAFAGWEGAVAAPDLPGHGAAAPPVGGHHELGDAVFSLIDHLSPAPGAEPIVLGVGRNGVVARTLALGGRAAALVLVDGLGGPWLDMPARSAAVRDVRRSILATPGALDPHAPGSTDVRSTLVVDPADRPHTIEMLAALPVPTLVIETPASPTPDAPAVAGVIPDHNLVTLTDDSPDAVASTVEHWWLTTRSMVDPA